MVWVNGVPFLNVQGVENDDAQWLFFRYEIFGTDGLRLRSLKEDIKVGPTASDLRMFVERNLHRAEIYTEAARISEDGIARGCGTAAASLLANQPMASPQ